MDNQIDELETFNEGVEVGSDIMARKGWHKVTDCISSLPKGSKTVIGYWDAWPGRTEVCWFEIIKTNDGLFVKCFPHFGEMKHLGIPTYWSPIPDPMDYE